MRVTKDLIPLFIYLLTITLVTARQAVVVQKTKLCGDESCNKVLFTSKVIRSLPSTHPSFLEVQENVWFEVTAIKFSDRVDIMEGRIKGEPEKRGIVFYSALDKGPYVEFLREAISTKKTLQQVVQDYTSAATKAINVVRAEADLVRDYNVQAKAYAVEQNLPVPEEIPEAVKAISGHGHSHGAHGHSHGAHGHSHGAHGHSHGAHGHTHDAHDHSHDAHDHSHDAHDHSHDAHDHSHDAPGHSHGVQVESSTIPPPQVESSTISPEIEASTVTPDMKASTITPEMIASTMILQEEASSITPQVEASTIPPPQVEASTIPPPPVESSTISPPQVESSTISPEIEASTITPEMKAPTITPEMKAPTITPEMIASTMILQEEASAIPPQVEASTIPPPQVEASTIPPPQGEASTIPPPPVESSTISPEIEASTITPEMKASTIIHQEEASAIPPQVEASTVPPSIEATTVVQLEYSTAPALVTTDPPIIEEDVQGVCDGDDCHKVLSSAPSPAEIEDPLLANPFEEGFSDKFDPVPDAPVISAEPNMFSYFCQNYVLNTLRSVLPVGDLSDAGVGILLNILFVVTAITIYLISYFLSDNGDSLYFDRNIAHDLATKCKVLQEQLRQKDEELQRAGNNTTRSQEHLNELSALRLELEPLKFERTQLNQRLTQIQTDFTRECSEKESLQKSLDKLREHITQYESNAQLAESRNREVASDLEKTNKELKETRSALERVEKDLISEREKLKKIVADYDNAVEEAREKDTEVSNLQQRQAELISANEQLKSELKVASEMFSMDEPTRKAEADATTESGGSGGWSDFGDEPDYEEKVEKEKSAPPAGDIRELIKIRAQQTKLEQECQSVKQQLERTMEEKNKIEELYAIARKDLLRKSKEVEQRDAERIGADERANKLLSLIDSNASKLKDTEATCDKLRDDLQRLRENMLDIQEEKRQKEDKIKELDAELKKVRAEFAKLEHKSFHQVFDLKRKLEEAQLVQPKIIESSFEMPNLSSSSIDADPSSREAPELLWADDRPTRYRTMSPQEEFSMDSNMPIVKKSSRGRRSDKLLREPFSSDGERREKKDVGAPSRRRSRSHGRQRLKNEDWVDDVKQLIRKEFKEQGIMDVDSNTLYEQLKGPARRFI